MDSKAVVILSGAKNLVTNNETLRSAQSDKQTKISVIIPTYNRFHLLVETLASVYRQIRRADEIIVVDDGSTDGTIALDAAPSDRLIYHRIVHAGASAARNAGLALARGDYIAFLDSDDLWEPTFLERMTAALDSAPNAGFVYCDYATFDARGVAQPAYLPPQHKLRGNLFAALLETDFISTGALLIRRAALARVGGFDPALTIAHDWDLWLRLAREFDAEYVDAPLVRIRIDSEGLTRDSARLYTENLRVLRKWRRETRGGARLARVIRQNIIACYRGLLKHFWLVCCPWRVLKRYAHKLATQFQ